MPQSGAACREGAALDTRILPRSLRSERLVRSTRVEYGTVFLVPFVSFFVLLVFCSLALGKTGWQALIRAGEFAAKHGARNKILKFIDQSLQAKQCGDLSPVPNLVHNDVDRDFSWCDLHVPTQDPELFRHIPLVRWERFKQL